MVQLCDDDRQAILNKKSLQVANKNKNIILTGKKNKLDGLKDIPLKPTHSPAQTANAIVQMNKYQKQSTL